MTQARRHNRQRGVAMITVIMVAAALTVTASTAALVTIREFGASQDDTKAAKALSYAEAGLDRLVQKLRGNGFGWKDVMLSGCPGHDTIATGLISLNGTLGTGDFTVVVTPVSWNCSGAIPSVRTKQQVALTSTGSHPAARRVLEQIVELQVKALPIGLYADQSVNFNGQGNGGKIFTESLITPGSVTNREKTAFVGDDLFYTLGDIYSASELATLSLNAQTALPASVHAGGTISCSSNPCGNAKVEHPAVTDGQTGGTSTNLNCVANATTGGASPAQAAWDGSSAGGVIPPAVTCSGSSLGKAPTSLFSLQQAKDLAQLQQLSEPDFVNLRNTARTTGIYCTLTACTKNGGASFNPPGTWQDADLAGLPKVFTAYFDFPAVGDPLASQRIVKWAAQWNPCSSGKAAVIIVRHGSFDMAGNNTLVGAIIVPDGLVDLSGGGRYEGTVISSQLRISGNSDLLLSQCFVENLPGVLWNVQTQHWSEVDR
jgi:hypothetical protein